MESGPPYDRQHPFLASITGRYDLCKGGSGKDTRHVVISLKGSDIKYQVGDSIAVFPSNDPQLVNRTLSLLRAKGEEIIRDKKGDFYNLQTYLTTHANLKGISKKALTEIAARMANSSSSELNTLLSEEHKDALKEWLHTHALIDLLEKYPEIHLKPQEFVDLAMPLLPRFYSIASSQGIVGDEVHLTVAYLKYESSGQERVGVCTHYLCHLAPLNVPVVPVYLHPSHDFRLPASSTASLIMIGPGTGVAPFRAFLQEREYQNHSGKNWLFFGERTRECEFYYEEEWKRWESLGLLRLDTAFSRDQPEKIYVQHRLFERGEELYQWLEEGAYVYVCGDAHRMAKDVDQVLHKIIQLHGKLNEEDAHAYMKKLRHEKRYLRDVY